MRKLFYYISRIFFSKEKLLLIQLLNIIQDDLHRFNDGTVEMNGPGMCYYLSWMSLDHNDYILLRDIIYSHRETSCDEDNNYFFPPFQYEPRYEFLKELIKKY